MTDTPETGRSPARRVNGAHPGRSDRPGLRETPDDPVEQRRIRRRQTAAAIATILAIIALALIQGFVFSAPHKIPGTH